MPFCRRPSPPPQSSPRCEKYEWHSYVRHHQWGQRTGLRRVLFNMNCIIIWSRVKAAFLNYVAYFTEPEQQQFAEFCPKVTASLWLECVWWSKTLPTLLDRVIRFRDPAFFPLPSVPVCNLWLDEGRVLSIAIKGHARGLGKIYQILLYRRVQI